MPKTSLETAAGWKTISWHKLERNVFKLQKRIFKASVRGESEIVRQLQKTLIQSRSARYLALRKAIREDKNAGIKLLSSEQKIQLAENLKLGKKNQLFRKKSVSVLYDRALQVLITMALEPDRPLEGESERDAIEAIYRSINKRSKYVLNADIAECCDGIECETVLSRLPIYPKIRRQFKIWLGSGKSTFPLLVDMLLKCLKDYLVESSSTTTKQFAHRGEKNPLTFIIFKGNLAVLHEDLTLIEHCQQKISQWLDESNWKLKPEKIGINHTREGFDFLGFNIRQLDSNKSKSLKTIIEPSQKSLREHWREINIIFKKHKSASQANLIYRLLPKIRAWVEYYRTANSKEVFKMLDTLMWNKLRAWAKRRHPKKSTRYWIEKYWLSIGFRNWIFAGQKDGKIEVCLPKYARYPRGI